jgi:hypothetical protein
MHIELFDIEAQAKVLIIGRDRYRDGLKKFDGKTRIYVSGIDNTPELVQLDAQLPQPKMKGEDAVNDKAYRQFNRKYAQVACNLARTILITLAENFEEINSDVKLRFSSVAGCSCGCSPGMIMDERIKLNNVPVDIHITSTRG